MYTSVFFKYANNGRVVTHAVGEQWEWDEVAPCVPNATYERTYAWEFRYDAARQRYATRPLNPTGLNAVNPQYYNKGRMWSDYDGDSLYGDFEIQSGQGGHTIKRNSYEPGLGRFAWTSGQPDYTTERYYHSDHLGSVRGTTDFFSTWVEPLAYTAFGERITGTQNSYMTRVGYVGAHGYQSTPLFETTPDTDIGFLHLGHRYYDPASGRFLQRDPIGIEGGLNVYQYVLASPAAKIDTSGTGPIGRKVGGFIGAGVGGVAGFLACGLITKNPVAAGGAAGSGGYAGGELGEWIGDWIGDFLGGSSGCCDETSLDITVTLPPPPPPIPPRGPVFERPWWEKEGMPSPPRK